MAERSNSAPDERQPLLSRERTASQIPEDSGSANVSEKGFFKKLLPRFDVVSPRYRWIPLLGCLIIVFNEAEYMFKGVAMQRAIEALHCIEYYERHDPDIARMGKHIPEAMCKIDSIEKQVAKTAAFQLFFRMFSAMIGNIPLGYVADKKGRWIVLSLHKINIMCSGIAQILVYTLYPRIPVWGFYLTGLPGLIGGNFDLGLAMLFAAYTDVMPSQAQRTTLFFLTTSMQYPAQAICPLISGWLMDLDGQGTTPEVALYVGFASGAIAAALTLFFFPETIQEIKKVAQTDDDQAKSDDGTSADLGKEHGFGQRIVAKLKSTQKDFQRSVHGIGIINLLLLAVSILTASIGIKSIDWLGLVQYPVIKFHWKFAQSTTVVSLQAVIILINYAFLLPSYNRLGTQHFGLSPARTSMAIMISSIVLLTIGAAITGASATVAVFFVGLLVYTLGSGLPVATQAFIAQLIDKTKLARTLASLSVASVGGKVLASALFPKVLAAGLDDGREVMKGLPLFVGAILFVVAGVAIGAVAVTTRSKTAGDRVHSDSESAEEESGHSSS